jgi:hypothetical protein
MLAQMMLRAAATRTFDKHAVWKRKRMKTKIRRTVMGSVRHGSAKTAGTIAATVAVSAAAIALGVVTAGAGVAVMLAIAGGSYAVSRLAREGTSQAIDMSRRRTRKYLQNRPVARKAFDKSVVTSQTTEVSDAIRRAVDHFRKAVAYTTDFEDEVKASSRQLDCAGAVNLVLAKARMMHELEKTEMYLMPGFDLMLMISKDILVVFDKLKIAERELLNAIAESIETSQHTGCRGVCYGSTIPGGIIPKKPKSSRGNLHPMAWSRVKSEFQCIHQDAEKFLRRYEQSVGSGQLAGAIPTGHDGDLYAADRLRALYEDAYRKFENPNWRVRVGHHFRNRYTRSTKSEKTAAAIREVLMLARAGAGMGAGAGAASESITRSAAFGISKSMAAGSLAGRKVADFSLSFGDWSVGKKTVGDNSKGIKQQGRRTSTMVKKVCAHYRETADWVKEFQHRVVTIDWRGGNTCDELWEASKALMEAKHHLTKTFIHFEDFYILSICIGSHLENRLTAINRAWAPVERAVQLAIVGDATAHKDCTNFFKTNPCYGPHPRNPGLPVSRL